jgi:DNA-binding XRE family transcriptional regulator
MKRSSYRDRDYAFGQTMLTLRTKIGFTQPALADYLGVSRFAVGAWEAGGTYPKAKHLQAFITLAVQHQAFSTGREADEIRHCGVHHTRKCCWMRVGSRSFSHCKLTTKPDALCILLQQ